jgi:uncharacterized damage-inducible protein DinB
MTDTAPYPAGSLGTYMELYEAQVRELLHFLRGLSASDQAAKACFGETTVTVPQILEHVAHAGMAYAEDARGALKGPESKEKIQLPPDPLEAIANIVPRMRDALEGAWSLTDPQLAQIVIDTPWNQRFTLDQMLEHAIVHILYHRRQLKRVLQKAALEEQQALPPDESPAAPPRV